MIFNYKIYFQYTTIRSFAERIYAGKVTIDEAEEDQSHLLKIQQNLMKNPDQEQKKLRIKKILMKVYMFFMKDKN